MAPARKPYKPTTPLHFLVHSSFPALPPKKQPGLSALALRKPRNADTTRSQATAPLSWAQVVKAKPKAGPVAPVAPTPRGTVPKPQRYQLDNKELADFRAGILPQRLLPGFISRAVGAYRHYAGLGRPGPLPKATFLMIKQTARKNLMTVCTSFLNGKTKREATLAAQAAGKAARLAHAGSRPEVKPQVEIAAQKTPPAPEVRIVVKEIVKEVEKVVVREVAPRALQDEVAQLKSLVTSLQKTVEETKRRTWYPANSLKGRLYKGSTLPELAAAPDAFVETMFETDNETLVVRFSKSWFDVELATKDASHPPLTFLRVSKKTALVVSSRPLPVHYLQLGDFFLCNYVSGAMTGIIRSS